MPEFLPEVKLDVKEYVKDLESTNIEAITLVCKDAYGNSYYDTKFGHKNMKVKGDLLKELVQALHEKSIKIVAYYNVCCDDHEAARNPDYCQSDKHGKTIERFGYGTVCMNSPYRELVFEQLREIVRNYDVDGIFLDITYVFEEACYCEYCKELYRQIYGDDISPDPKSGTVERKNYLEFKRWTRFNFIKDAALTIKSIKDIPVGWNHAGDPYFCEVEVDEFADYFSREFHSPNYLLGDLVAKWMRCFKKPFELTIPECYRDWGEWTILPVNTLKLLFTIALVNGGNPTIGHVAYPSGAYAGRVAEGVLNSIREGFQWVRKIEDLCSDTESVPYVAVLHTVKNHRLKDFLGWPTMNSLEGTHHLLVDNHVHFDIISQASTEVLSKYEALIIPDEPHISKEEAEAISSFVENGGSIIASYRTSLYDERGTMKEDFELAHVLGVKFHGFSPYSINYLDGFKDSDSGYPRMPLLLKSRALQVEAEEIAQRIASLMYPAVETKPYRHVYHQHAHPAVRTEFPAIVYNAYKKGRCIYIALPIEEEFRSNHYYWLRNIYANALKQILPNPLLKVNGPISLRVSLMKKEGKLILHLIDYQHEDTGIVEEFKETGEVRVEIRHPSPRKITVYPSVKEIEWTEENGYIKFQVPPFKLHTMIVIK